MSFILQFGVQPGEMGTLGQGYDQRARCIIHVFWDPTGDWSSSKFGLSVVMDTSQDVTSCEVTDLSELWPVESCYFPWELIGIEEVGLQGVENGGGLAWFNLYTMISLQHLCCKWFCVQYGNTVLGDSGLRVLSQDSWASPSGPGRTSPPVCIPVLKRAILIPTQHKSLRFHCRVWPCLVKMSPFTVGMKHTEWTYQPKRVF